MFYPTIAPELHLNDTPKPRFVAINHDLQLVFLSQNAFQSGENCFQLKTNVLIIQMILLSILLDEYLEIFAF